MGLGVVPKQRAPCFVNMAATWAFMTAATRPGSLPQVMPVPNVKACGRARRGQVMRRVQRRWAARGQPARHQRGTGGAGTHDVFVAAVQLVAVRHDGTCWRQRQGDANKLAEALCAAPTCLRTPSPGPLPPLPPFQKGVGNCVHEGSTPYAPSSLRAQGDQGRSVRISGVCRGCPAQAARAAAGGPACDCQLRSQGDARLRAGRLVLRHVAVVCRGGGGWGEQERGE